MVHEELFPLASEQPEAKNIKVLLTQYTRYWYVFVISTILSVIGAFLYLHYYAVPQYSVYSTLLIKDDKNSQKLANTDVLNDLSTFKSTRNIDNEIEVIKSKSLMTRVVSELGMFSKYYVEGKVRNIEVYGSSSPIKVVVEKLKPNAPGKSFIIYTKSDSTFEFEENLNHSTVYKYGQPIQNDLGLFKVVSTPSKEATSKKIIVYLQDVNQVADYYNHTINVQPVNKNASILTLKLVDPIPAKARDIINKLTEVYNREAIEDNNSMATNTLKFLDERLGYLISDLSSVEKAVEKYKVVNGLTDISTQALNYTTQASSYDAKVSESAIQLNVLESIEKYLSNASTRYSLVPSSLGIKDETLLALVMKFNELQMERGRMLRTTQPGSLLVESVEEQLTRLRADILENLRNIKKGLQISSNNLKVNSGQFQSKIRRVPAMERELLEINRQKSIKQNLYSYLLQKREETALSLAASASASRVLDPAMGGDYPISPNGQVTYLMAILLGLVLPFACIYVLGVLNDEVQTQQDVISITPTPIIGEIAHNDEEKTVVVTKGSRSPIAEMFRLIRANFNFVAMGKDNLVVSVTSSRSGEGKTFFSINLAMSLAITGKRVVLLDLDLRNPKIAKELDLPEGAGITNYLVRKDISVDDIIRHSDKVPGLFVISSGIIPPNPAELLMSDKFTLLIKELRDTFDYIIFDTPPVGQVADAFILNGFVDFTFYMVRYNYTSKAWLSIIKNIYKSKSLKYPLLVLNDAKKRNGGSYGYGYGYGYEQKNIQKQKAL